MTEPRNCQHKNIYWEDFFKLPKKNKTYCLNCGTNKGKTFASVAQRWYAKEIKEWLVNNGLVEKKTVNNTDYYFCNNFIEFVKKNNYEQQWNDLNRGKIDGEYNFEGFTEQLTIWETAKSIEYICREFKKEKENNPNIPQPRKRKDNNQPTERESKFNKILTI